MRNLWQAFVLLTLLLALLQAPDLNEAKKIKKLVKELKKLKKYAYLLAATKKKLYAVPFPMPLPVFVKRQHIYTQVPIIPRYVQRPQTYGSPAHHHSESSSSYELMSDSSPVSVYPKSYHSASSARKKPASTSADYASQYLHNPAKYLGSIAGLLGHATPMSGSTNKDLLSKLLNGQARLLPPSALLSSIKSKGPTGSLQVVKQHEQQEQQTEQQEQQEQDSKSHSSSSSASSGVSYDEPAPSKTAAKHSESSSENKPSASELHKSAMAFKSMRPIYAPSPFINPYQFPAMMAPMMSPMAALMAAHRAQAMSQRLPMMRLPIAAGMMDQYEGANQLAEGQDAQEMAAAGSQDQETVSRDYPSNLAALLRQRLIQQQQQQPQLLEQAQNQRPSEQVMLALQKLQREQLLNRQQRAIKLALLREKEVAARLAESREILLRAHQLGLPMYPSVQQNLLAT